jgi:hypothetical protein
VCIQRDRPPDPDPEHHDKRIVAMDPGQRRFQTLYDPAIQQTITQRWCVVLDGATGTLLHLRRPKLPTPPLHLQCKMCSLGRLGTWVCTSGRFGATDNNH